MRDKINSKHGQETHDALGEVWDKIVAESERIEMDPMEFLFISITPLDDLNDKSLQDLLEEGNVEELTRFYELVKAQDDAALGETDTGTDSVAV